jgi:hypothetical protein
MKITEIKQCNSGLELQKAKLADGSPSEFNRLLAEESGKVGEAARAVDGGTELGALSPLARFHLSPVQNDFSDQYQKAELAVEGAIYRLEQLQMALQDPQGGLKNVASAIGDLCTGAEGLQQSVASLPEGHFLRQMADELAVMAHVESVKYRRGDYL